MRRLDGCALQRKAERKEGGEARHQIETASAPTLHPQRLGILPPAATVPVLPKIPVDKGVTDTGC